MIESAAFLVLDMLYVDGGWLSTSMILEWAGDREEKSVRRILTRLRQDGLVVGRPILDHETMRRGQENEWTITGLGRIMYEGAA